MRREFFGVIDYFAEFGLARCAWLNAETLKGRHHALLSEIHPDKAHGDTSRASLLNNGRRILENHASRLRHLAQLINPEFHSSGKVSPDWALFLRIGTASQSSMETARKKSNTKTRLMLAVLHKESSARIAELEILTGEIEKLATELKERTIRLDEGEFVPSVLWEISEEWTFLDRGWQSIQEALTALKM